MSLRARAMLGTLVLGAIILPMVTAHTLARAVVFHEHASGVAPFHLELMPLIGLTALSTAPLVGMIQGGVRWLISRRRVRELTRSGSRARLGGIDYLRIPGEQVTLFTAGVRRPMIYATTGAERSLSREAFEAGLLHERAHIRHHDLLWLAMIALAEAGIGMLPSARRALVNLRIEIEWQADQAALRAGAERQGLFDAIVGAADGIPGVAALSGAGTVERLRWLAEPGARPVEGAGIGAAFTGLLMPPVVAHVLVWTGLVCALCAQHLR